MEIETCRVSKEPLRGIKAQKRIQYFNEKPFGLKTAFK